MTKEPDKDAIDLTALFGDDWDAADDPDQPDPGIGDVAALQTFFAADVVDAPPTSLTAESILVAARQANDGRQSAGLPPIADDVLPVVDDAPPEGPVPAARPPSERIEPITDRLTVVPFPGQQTGGYAAPTGPGQAPIAAAQPRGNRSADRRVGVSVAPGPGAPPQVVDELAARRQRRASRWLIAAAAVAIMAIGIPVTLNLTTGNSDSGIANPQINRASTQPAPGANQDGAGGAAPTTDATRAEATPTEPSSTRNNAHPPGDSENNSKTESEPPQASAAATTTNAPAPVAPCPWPTLPGAAARVVLDSLGRVVEPGVRMSADCLPERVAAGRFVAKSGAGSVEVKVRKSAVGACEQSGCQAKEDELYLMEHDGVRGALAYGGGLEISVSTSIPSVTDAELLALAGKLATVVR